MVNFVKNYDNMKSVTLNFFSIALLLLCFINSANGQSINSSSYKTAIGLRAGGTSGLTIKHFTSSYTAFEGILGIWHRSVTATLLYEKHAAAFDVSGMRWYYGAGGHIAAYGRSSFYDDFRGARYGYRYRDRGGAIGVDGIVGLEYKINPIPIAISIDLKPNIELTTYGSAYLFLDPGLGIKFTF
jgi:hypothetical protein